MDKQKLITIGVVAICLIIAGICFGRLFYSIQQYDEANKEYTSIVENSTKVIKRKKAVQTYQGTGSLEVVTNPSSIDVVTYSLPDLTIDFQSLLKVNPDCIGWIYIPGVEISYPIVQSHDNIEYVSTTFNGNENMAGCIFSDCRITTPFIQKTILYGHNMKNGSMFHKLFDIEVNREEYKDVWIYLVDGSIYHYKITDVKRVEMTDKDIYNVSATYDNTLVLSTCVKETKRLVVIAERDWYFFS